MKCSKRCPASTTDALSTPGHGGAGGASTTLLDLISSVNTLIDNLSSPDESAGPLAEGVVANEAEKADEESHSTANINQQLTRLERLFAQGKRKRQAAQRASTTGGGRRLHQQHQALQPPAKSKQRRSKRQPPKRRDACGGCSRSPCSNCTTSNCNALSTSRGGGGVRAGGGGTDISSAEFSRSRMCCATVNSSKRPSQPASKPTQLQELRAVARPLRHSLPAALRSPQQPTPQHSELPRAALQQLSSSSNSRLRKLPDAPTQPAAAAAAAAAPGESSLSIGDNASNPRQFVVRRGRRGAAEEAAAAREADRQRRQNEQVADQVGGEGSSAWLGERMDFGYLKCGLGDGGLGQSGDQTCADNLAKLECAISGMQEQVEQLNRTFEQQQSIPVRDPCDPAPNRLQEEIRRAQARIAWLRGFLRPSAGAVCGCRHRGAATELARDPLADLKCRYERSLLYSCFDVSWPFLHIIAPRPPTFDDPVCCEEDF